MKKKILGIVAAFFMIVGIANYAKACITVHLSCDKTVFACGMENEPAIVIINWAIFNNNLFCGTSIGYVIVDWEEDCPDGD